MTDKELDQKLTAAFDNVRADSAVKARIRKGLTGDIMDSNKTITVSKTADKNERTGTIKVNRRGRIAAAAIAGVIAVGGGAYMLKSGFARVEPKTSLSSKAESDSSSAHSDKMTYNGKEVDELPLTNEQMGFDPAAHGIYEKFGKMGAIYKLSNGNYLVSKLYEDETEDELKDYYAIYDPTTNSIKSVLTDEKWTSFNIGENGIVFFSENDDYTDDNVKTDLTCQVYDLDLVSLENSTMNLQFTDKMIREVMITPDNKVYTAVNELNPDSENKDRLYIYDSEGNVIHTSKECDYINCCFMSKDGGFIYYGSENDQESATLTGVAISDAYIDCEHTDGIYSDNKLHYPLYFDSGKYLYTVFYTDEGKQKIRRIDMTGKEELYFGEPEDVINYAGESDNDCYVTPDGKYLFVTNDEEYSDDNNPYHYKASVYDIDNGLKLVHEEKFYSVPLIRDSVLYDEDTGDVCIVASHSSYYDEIVTFNLFGKKFSNFNLTETVKDTTIEDNKDTNKNENKDNTEVKEKVKENSKSETNTNTEKTAIVPDITGSDSADGRKKLKAAGFKVLVISMHDDKIPKGHVVKTEPAAGEKAPLNSKVTIYESVGPASEENGHLIGSMSLPEGLRGKFTVAVDSDNYHYTYDFIGEDKDNALTLSYAGENTEVFTITITNRDTGKSVVYCKSEVNFKNGRFNDISGPDKDGLLAISSDEEVKSSEVTLSIPIPEGLHGPYTAKVGDERISGDADKKEPISVTLTGRGIKEYHVEIDSNKTHKSFNGGIYSVNFDENTVERLDNNCLYDTYYISDDGKLCLLYDGLLLPEGLHGTYTADIISDNDSYTDTLDSDETFLSFFTLKFNGNGTQTYTVKFTNDETGNSVEYCKFKVNFEDMELSYISGPNKDGLLAISPKD